MKIIETKITEALLDQITERVVNEDAMIRVDADDVNKVIAAKCGMMYEAHYEGESYSDFMKSFFNELAAKPEVKNCTNVLISIEMSENVPFMMDDMNIIHEFMEVFTNDFQAAWGVSTNRSGGGMTLLVICTS